MRMAFPISSIEDLRSREFEAYLRERGVDPDLVLTGKVSLRCKPTQGTYGCYGHVSGRLPDIEFLANLNSNMRLRGHYVVQVEMDTPRVTNTTDRREYTFIDRNFFGLVNGRPTFLGGFRNMMSVYSTEARAGRIHGNKSAVWGEITSR